MAYIADNYIHSRIITSIIDNSIIEDEVVIPIDFVLFQPYFSDEGVDGVVKQWQYETDFVNANGTPNSTKHGLQIYNVIEWLRGGGTVLGLRLTADDAYSSFGVLTIRTKNVPVGEGNPDNYTKLKISPTLLPVPTSYITLYKDYPVALQMKQIMNKIMTDPDSPLIESGWTNHYLTLFKVTGKGKYGNNFGISFGLDSTREEDLEESRRWFYTVYKKDNKGNVSSVAESYSISFNQSATDAFGTTSEYIDTVVVTDAYKKVFDNLVVYTHEDSYNDMIKLFGDYAGEIVSDSTVVSEAQDPNFIDFFTLLDRNGVAYKRYIKPTEAEIAAFNYKEVFTAHDSIGYMANGSNGNLDADNYWDPVAKKYKIDGVEATIDQVYAKINSLAEILLQKAYQGKIDANILSPYKYQISAIVDSNNPDLVKKEMTNLCNKRLDIIGYLDCGFRNSIETCINYKKTTFTGYEYWCTSMWPQSGTAYDSYNKKNIDVTMGYELAFELPYVRTTYGPNRLVAGAEKGLMRAVSSLNWYPQDDDQKDQLVRAGLNYVEEYKLNKFAIMSNITTYPKRKSYLKVIRNCHCIAEAIYTGRQILTELRFVENPKAALIEAKERVERNLQYLITNGPVERLVVVAEQSEQEKYENMGSLTIEMKFTDFIQTWNFRVVAAR